MKRPVGRLTAFLRLDKVQFDKGLKSVRGRVTALGAFVKRTLAPLAVLGAGIGTTQSVRRALDLIDAQAKLARSMNTTVSSMQVLERAGELAGVSMSQLETGSKDLFRRLSQAAGGTGPAAEALQELKLSANDLISLPLDQRIEAINQALLDHVPSARRAAVAGALFGEEGSIAMTRLDPATLRQANDEIQRFGREVSQVEAAKIEQTNDALSRLGLIGRGLGTDLTVAIAPALTAIANGLSGMVAGYRQVRTFLGDVLFLYRETAQAVNGSLGIIDAVRAAFAAVWSAVVGAFRAVSGFVGGLRVLAEQSGGIGAVWDHLGSLASEVAQRIADVFRAAGQALRGAFQTAVGHVITYFADMVARGVEFGARMTDIALGAKDAMIAAFGALPNALGSLMYQGANAAIQGVESMINGVIDRVNRFITAINGAIASLPDWARGDFGGLDTIDAVSLGGVGNPFAGSTGVAAAASAAFSARQGETNFGPGGAGLRSAGAGLISLGVQSGQTADTLFSGARRPLAALGDLSSAIDAAAQSAEAAQAESDALADGLDQVAVAGGSASDALGGGGGGSAAGSGGGGVAGAADKAKSSLETLRENVRSISERLGDAVTSANSFGEAWGNVKSLALDAIRKIAANWASNGIETIINRMSGIGSGGGTPNLFGRLLGGLFPGRAMGGGVRAGQIYQVNEQTPRSEWMFVGANGGVLNHGQMTNAVSRAMGGRSSQEAGRMRIMLDAGLKAEFLNAAAEQSVEIARMGIEANNTSVRQAQRRG
ncbi:phage tail tape measure protein [Shimia ponticola]|uniref:phage tail tape measure protein n=1 Tax=Shimia ponticola TaxID=2582893 RepID=UPI0011BF8766|nr:phage tail tape measure protein [Shimia ponticola]